MNEVGEASSCCSSRAPTLPSESWDVHVQSLLTGRNRKFTNESSRSFVNFNCDKPFVSITFLDCLVG